MNIYIYVYVHMCTYHTCIWIYILHIYIQTHTFTNVWNHQLCTPRPIWRGRRKAVATAIACGSATHVKRELLTRKRTCNKDSSAFSCIPAPPLQWHQGTPTLPRPHLLQELPMRAPPTGWFLESACWSRVVRPECVCVFVCMYARASESGLDVCVCVCVCTSRENCESRKRMHRQWSDAQLSARVKCFCICSAAFLHVKIVSYDVQGPHK